MKHLKTLCYFLLLLCVLPVIAENSPTGKLPLTQAEIDWIEQNPEVSVGHMKNLEPTLIITENGDQVGIIPAILDLLTEQTGLRFRLDLAPNWQTVLDNGKTRKVDMLASLPSTLKLHQEHYLFSEPYFKTYFYIYAPKLAALQIPKHTSQDLKGKRVAYDVSFRAVELFAEKNKDIDFIPYPDRESLIGALTTGEVDFFLSVGSTEYWRKKNGIDSFKISGIVKELSLDVSMAIRNDEPLLSSIINKAFLATKQERAKIVYDWTAMSQGVIHLNSSNRLSPVEKIWLKENPVIRVGFDPFRAPIESVSDLLEPKGITTDYLHRLEELLDIRFKYVKGIDWAEAQQQLDNQRLDVLAAVSSTPSNNKKWELTSPYLTMPIGIFSGIDSAYIGGLEALKGRRVAVVEGYAIHDWLVKDHPELELITAPTIKDALNLLAKGKAYAFVGNLITTSHYIGNEGLTQIKIVGETNYSNDLRMAVNANTPFLAGILQKGLNAISKTERDAIYNNWISIEYKHSMDYTLLWKVLAGIAVVLATILYWNRRMAKEVAHRREIEAQLQEANEILENLSVIDDLTGLYNRRVLDKTLAHEISNSAQGRIPFSVVLFDLDHFKLVNDTYGHLAGDIVLKKVAHEAMNLIRPKDVLVRYGGEEFLLVLPNTVMTAAGTIAERLRIQIADIGFTEPDLPSDFKVTASFGVASYVDGTKSQSELIKLADDALYEAKEGGRNQVFSAR